MDFATRRHDRPSEKNKRTTLSRTELSLETLLVHCLGFGACWGWIHSAFFSTALWNETSEMLGLYAWLVNVATNGIAMIAFGAIALRYAPLGKKPFFVYGSLILLFLGTIGLASPTGRSPLPVFAGSILSAIGSAGVLLLWAESYKRIPPNYAKKYTIPLSMATGVAIFLVVNMIPSKFAPFAIAALPFVSVLLWKKGNASDIEFAKEENGELRQEIGTQRTKRTPIKALRDIVPLRFILYIAVYCLAPGFIRGSTSVFRFASEAHTGSEVFAGVAIVMVLIAIVSILALKEPEMDFAYKMVVPLMSAGLLLLPFLNAGEKTLAGSAIMSGYILFEMYVWAQLSDTASNRNAPFASIFGIGKSGMNIGLLLGTFFGMHFASSSSMLLMGASVFIIYLFIVMESIFSNRERASLPVPYPGNKNNGGKISSREQNEEASPVSTMTVDEAAKMNLSEAFESLLAEKCQTAAIRYGLSNRELEVLELLARGQNLQSVAENLGIAYSTVKTHTDHIYQKTDVHSRSELMRLIEGI